MNFTLAETPMRIRSINTQKVLGATTTKLRSSLLAEAVLISLIAFVVAMAFVYLAHDLGLQELVQGSILLKDHLWLIGVLPASLGAERLVWSVAQRSYAAHHPDLFAIHHILHAGDWRGHHVLAELSHLSY